MNAEQLEDLFYDEPQQASSASESYRLLSTHFQDVARKAIKYSEQLEERISKLEKANTFGVTFSWEDGSELFVPALSVYRGIRMNGCRPISSNSVVQQAKIKEWFQHTEHVLQTRNLNVI
jgi:hypothetical protein